MMLYCRLTMIISANQTLHHKGNIFEIIVVNVLIFLNVWFFFKSPKVKLNLIL